MCVLLRSSTLVGFGYPTYATFKLLESNADAAACRSCLTYWTVLGVFVLMEGPIDMALSWIPLYSIARVFFQAWLFGRDFAGAAVVYRTAVVPLVSQVDHVVQIIAKELDASPAVAKK